MTEKIIDTLNEKIAELEFEIEKKRETLRGYQSHLCLVENQKKRPLQTEPIYITLSLLSSLYKNRSKEYGYEVTDSGDKGTVKPTGPGSRDLYTKHYIDQIISMYIGEAFSMSNTEFNALSDYFEKTLGLDFSKFQIDAFETDESLTYETLQKTIRESFKKDAFLLFEIAIRNLDEQTIEGPIKFPPMVNFNYHQNLMVELK